MEVRSDNAYNVQSAISQLGGVILVSGYPTYFYDCKEEAFFDLYLKPKMFGEKDKRFIDEAEPPQSGGDLSYSLRPVSSNDSKSTRVGSNYEFDTQFKVVTKQELFRPEGLALYLSNTNKLMDAFEFSLFKQIQRIDRFRIEDKKSETAITDDGIETMLNFIVAHLQIKKQEGGL